MKIMPIPTPPDPFDDWLRQPLGLASEDPRFEVRRALPTDFDAIYDLVEEAFGRPRPRAAFDWLYRRNPFGRARCWIVCERDSGAIVKTGAFFPWPIWKGDEPLVGSLSGDAATAIRWQRKGLSAIRRRVRRSHPWAGTICTIAGPNESSRIVTNKAGEGSSILGPLSGGVLALDATRVLGRLGVPSGLARPVGGAANGMLSAWRRAALRSAKHASARVEQIERFERGFDAVTYRTMSWSKYWCPHNAEFLNWRYLDHPTESCVGLALVEDDHPTAYALVRLGDGQATLSEFAVETTPRERSLLLLSAAIDLARSAGCGFMTFFATPTWRHWSLFRRVGFLPYTTSNYLDASDKRDPLESEMLENWQVTPGDRDYR